MSTLNRILSLLSLLSCIPLIVEASIAAHQRTFEERPELAPWQTWGPYRPNLYFGVRPLVPETFLMGLMWASGETRDAMLNTLRDTCEQNDGMQGYGWTAYDTRIGGSQTMRDQELHVNLTTDFFKSEGGDSWGVRVTGSPRSDAPSNVKTTIILHAAMEKAAGNNGTDRSLACEHGDQGSQKTAGNNDVACHGEAPGLGSFQFYIVGDPENKVVHETSVKSIQVPEEKIWQAKSVFSEQAKASGDDGIAVSDEPGVGNMHFVQSTFQGSFTVTFTYHASEAVPLKPEDLVAGLDSFSSDFPAAVERVFPSAAPFEGKAYGEFSQALISNLLGGLGFFHGDSNVDYTHAPEYEEVDLDFWEKAASARARAAITTTPPASLLSYSPSRPFFPRGFLWDEGFHLLPVVERDLDLAVAVLRSWLNLMDEDGWIAREQILGPEARSRVPEEFQVQYPHYANPPTLLLLFPILISKITGKSAYNGHPSEFISSQNAGSRMLRELYPLISRHYAWFRRTQAGNFSGAYPRPEGAIEGEGYRWRGRSPMHTLTSGLDDYPRANPPHPGELHVDALAWVGTSARTLQLIAEHLGEVDEAATYKKHVDAVKKNLDLLHWDNDAQAYCDTTIASSNQFERVCHYGYIALFPLLLGLLDAEHPNLPPLLDLLSNPDRLWSPHGLRSLSAADEHYGKDENYWRGAVWMNLNTLAVLRLRDLGLEADNSSDGSPTPIQARALSLAADLRKRIVDTVYKSWKQTGFVWEQYKDTTGEGTGIRAFTGWTACVILLMGLDFTGHIDEGRARVGSSPLIPLATLVVVVLLAIVFKRRVMNLAAYAVNRWQRWRVGWRTGYEEVIDLDERVS